MENSTYELFHFLGELQMHQSLRDKIISVCAQKITKNGETVGVSFYAFFANKNDNP